MAADPMFKAPLSAPRTALEDWLLAMDQIADEDGYLEPLGASHWAFFAESGPKIIVTFCLADEVRSHNQHLPPGYEIAREKGWSYLCVIAEGETFWRAPEVWGYFDRLVDDAFFDDFDQVLFTGEGAAGYAAACYVVSAPGARALLFAPRATLSPAIAGWDKRHPKARKLDFTSRYGYAPDMTEGAGRVWLAFDPYQNNDACHAALFRAPWVKQFALAHAGPAPSAILKASQLYPQILEQAMSGRISMPKLYKMWRARKDSALYLRNLLARAHTRASLRGGTAFQRAICHAAIAKGKGESFARFLAQLEPKSAP